MAKFLEGRERRAEWAESYGSHKGSKVENGNQGSREGGGMYRIWNGTQGEMSVTCHEHLGITNTEHNIETVF